MRFREIIGEEAMLLSADRQEIPSVVYHGTRLSTWQDIISKEGLKPFAAGDDRAGRTWDRPFIFLSWAAYGAARYASNEINSFEEGEKGVVLAITLTPQIAGKIRTKLGEFLRCPVAIPASMIHVHKILNN
jgi:hypothetical protein